MRMNLSEAELAVLAEHLSIDPSFAIGERPEPEMDRLRAEGLRSLVARGLVRPEGEETKISTELATLGVDILAPKGLFTYTRYVNEVAQTSTILVGRRSLISATPLVDGVGAYASVDASRVADVIVEDLNSPDGSSGVYRVEGVNGIEQRSAGEFTWAQRPSGDVVRLAPNEGVEASAEQIRGDVEGLLVSLEAIGSDRDGSEERT